MKKLLGMLLAAIVFTGAIAIPAEPASAITCAQKQIMIADALTRGDIAAAASYQRLACTSGSSSSSGSVTVTLTCTQRNLNIADAITRGDIASAAYWQAAACTNGSSSSSGGSSGGSSSGSSNSGGGSATVPTCNGAPGAPVVTYRYTKTAIVVKLSAAAAGEMTNRIAFTVSYFNSATSVWGAWQNWAYATPGGEITFAKPSPDETKIALDSLAQNACGNSTRTRLDTDTKGLLIFNPPMDEVLQNVSSMNQGENVLIGAVTSTTSGQTPKVFVNTPQVCSLVNGTLVATNSGICQLVVTSLGTADLTTKTTTLSIIVIGLTKTITCYKKGNSKVTKKVTGTKPVCPTGYSTTKS